MLAHNDIPTTTGLLLSIFILSNLHKKTVEFAEKHLLAPTWLQPPPQPQHHPNHKPTPPCHWRRRRHRHQLHSKWY